jgi:hypothetical protein
MGRHYDLAGIRLLQPPYAKVTVAAQVTFVSHQFCDEQED